MALITGDFTDSDWLLLVEDEGPRGLGRVRGFFVFDTEADAQRAGSLRYLCDCLELFVGEEIPWDVATEVMTYADFRASYWLSDAVVQ